jgi:cytochrome c biogenesis protein CcmG, thiol:disulfide interchange protein DsbE
MLGRTTSRGWDATGEKVGAFGAGRNGAERRTSGAISVQPKESNAERGRLSFVRRILTWQNLLLALVLAWAAPRLLPHLGAALGVASRTHAMPRYAVTTLDGAPLTADALRGRVVLVNFWATWCLPCRVEMPLLQRMYDRHRDRGLVVLGLSVDRGDPATVRAFLRERGVTYPVAVVGGNVARAFGGVRGYPTSILVDRTGVVRHSVIGPLAAASMEPAVRRLLAETR